MPTIVVDTLVLQFSMVITLILLIKLFLTLSIQGAKKFETGSRPPEDQTFSSLQGFDHQQSFVAPLTDKPTVSSAAIEADLRWQRIVANDLENLPFGLIVMWAACFARGSNIAHCAAASVFCVCRLMHTVFYAYGMQPHRALVWTTGTAASLAMALNGVVVLFGWGCAQIQVFEIAVDMLQELGNVTEKILLSLVLLTLSSIFVSLVHFSDHVLSSDDLQTSAQLVAPTHRPRNSFSEITLLKNNWG